MIEMKEPRTEAGRSLVAGTEVCTACPQGAWHVDAFGFEGTEVLSAVSAIEAELLERLASGIKAALVIRLIAGEVDQTYNPTEVSTMVSAVIDEQVARL